MRADIVLGDKTQTTIFDLDGQKMYIFDSKKKEADVWDMAAFAAELSKNVSTDKMTASLKPNGQTVAGQTATGYDIEIRRLRWPAAPTCRCSSRSRDDVDREGAPGTDDYIRYKAAAEKGWVLSDPRAARALRARRAP